MDESKHLIKKRFSKAVTTYHDNAIIQRLIASTLFSCYNRFNDETEKNVLEIGCGSGFLPKEILDGCNLSKITINDIVDYSERIGLLINSFQNIDYKFMQGDAENLIYNESYDLIFSSSVFQWFSNLRFFLQKASMFLHKDGIIDFSTFLTGNQY